MPAFAKFDGVDGEATDRPNDDSFVFKSWSTSGDADDRPTEEVAFYYNKIAFENAPFKSSTKLVVGEGDGPLENIVEGQNDTYVEWTY